MKLITRKPFELSDDELASEFVYWFRVSRNENGLKGEERAYFKDISS